MIAPTLVTPDYGPITCCAMDPPIDDPMIPTGYWITFLGGEVIYRLTLP